jgi:hypothetical protein
VYEKNILIGRGTRRDEIGWLRYSSLQQLAVDAEIFFRRKDMRSNGQIIIVAINQLKRKFCHAG